MSPARLRRAPQAGLAYTPYVAKLLWLSKGTCLVRSLVLQRWYADHGEAFDVIVGVTAPSGGFRAHAWLDLPGVTAPDYQEFQRIPFVAP